MSAGLADDLFLKRPRPRTAASTAKKRLLPIYYFFGAAGLRDAGFWGGLAWAKSEAATDRAALLLFGLDRILPAMLASFLLVVMELSRRSRAPENERAMHHL